MKITRFVFSAALLGSAVRDREWKLIRYPGRDYTQLFDLKNDPLEITNLAENPTYRSKVDEMMKMMKKWQKQAGDTISLTAGKIFPMKYDPLKFKQKPDQFQPEYTLKKYFKSSGETKP